MDGILIFSSTIEWHAERMREVFDRLRGAIFPLDVTKCHFAQCQVVYLGHTIRRSVSRLSDSKVRAYDHIRGPEISGKVDPS